MQISHIRGVVCRFGGKLARGKAGGGGGGREGYPQKLG